MHKHWEKHLLNFKNPLLKILKYFYFSVNKS